MGTSISSFVVGEANMDVLDVRKRLADMIAESAHQDGHQYSGEIGSLSIHDFRIEDRIISEEDFYKRVDDLPKYNGFAIKVESRDRLDAPVLSIGPASVTKDGNPLAWTWLGEIRTHAKANQQDRVALSKMAVAYQEATQAYGSLSIQFRMLTNKINDPYNFDKFTILELNNLKRKLNTSRERVLNLWDKMVERVEKVREKLSPKTTTIKWMGAASCPS